MDDFCYALCWDRLSGKLVSCFSFSLSRTSVLRYSGILPGTIHAVICPPIHMVLLWLFFVA